MGGIVIKGFQGIGAIFFFLSVQVSLGKKKKQIRLEFFCVVPVDIDE